MRHLVPLSLVVSLACLAQPLLGQTPASQDDFGRIVAPFLAQHCTTCHGSELAENNLRLDTLQPARASTENRQVWMAMLDRLSLGTMPPKGEPRPRREEVENVIDWVRRALGISRNTPNAAELPGFGNYVDHALLFTEPAVRKAASPARLWRISPYIFR